MLLLIPCIPGILSVKCYKYLCKCDYEYQIAYKCPELPTGDQELPKRGSLHWFFSLLGLWWLNTALNVEFIGEVLCRYVHTNGQDPGEKDQNRSEDQEVPKH